MNRRISPKITASVFGILVTIFFISFYVFGWNEPGSPPPQGNVDAPINVSAVPQTKAGRLSVTELYDTNNPAYYLNPSGNSVLDNLNFGLRSVAPENPSQGQMYWNSVTKKLYFFDGTSWLKVSGTTQAYCQTYPTNPDDPNCGTISCNNWYAQTGVESPSDTEYCYNKQNMASNRCEGIDDCKDANSADCDSYPNASLQYSCGPCRYISATNCTGTTSGSCSLYPALTSCGGAGERCTSFVGGAVDCLKFKRAFVARWWGYANFGGLAGADAICQSEADAAGLGGQWMAWLSTGTVNAKDRIPDGYAFIEGFSFGGNLYTDDIIANSKIDILDGSLTNPIEKAADGNYVCTNSGPFPCTTLVWTGTKADGTSSGNNCKNWTYAPSSGYDGTSGTGGQFALVPGYNLGAQWTESGQYSCNTDSRMHLYCFEQ